MIKVKAKVHLLKDEVTKQLYHICVGKVYTGEYVWYNQSLKTWVLGAVNDDNFFRTRQEGVIEALRRSGFDIYKVIKNHQNKLVPF